MDKIKVIHDVQGHTLTVWFGNPNTEAVCEETTDEVVLMKDAAGRVIGFEMLHDTPASSDAGLSVETVVRTWVELRKVAPRRNAALPRSRSSAMAAKRTSTSRSGGRRRMNPPRSRPHTPQHNPRVGRGTARCAARRNCDRAQWFRRSVREGRASILTFECTTVVSCTSDRPNRETNVPIVACCIGLVVRR